MPVIPSDARENIKNISGRTLNAGMFKRSKGDLSVAQTLKLLKERGLEVVEDGSRSVAWYMIDPRTSKHIAKWDTVLVLALVVTALLTPYEVAFLPAPLKADWVFWANRIIDIVFMIDMIVTCFRMVSITSVVEGMRWISTPKELLRMYAKSGWLFIDGTTLIISLMDVVYPLLPRDDSSSLRKFKARTLVSTHRQPERNMPCPHLHPSPSA